MSIVDDATHVYMGQHLSAQQFHPEDYLPPGVGPHGTQHPVDVALGRARRLRNLHSVTKTSTEDVLNSASEVINAGASAPTMGKDF